MKTIMFIQGAVCTLLICSLAFNAYQWQLNPPFPDGPRIEALPLKSVE